MPSLPWFSPASSHRVLCVQTGTHTVQARAACSPTQGKHSPSSGAGGARVSSGEKAALAGSELSRARAIGGKEKIFAVKTMKQCSKSLESLHAYMTVLYIGAQW